MGGNAVFGVLLPSLSAKLWQGSTLPAGLGLRECMKQAHMPESDQTPSPLNWLIGLGTGQKEEG